MENVKKIGPQVVFVFAAVWSLIAVLGNRALVMQDELLFARAVIHESFLSNNVAGYFYKAMYAPVNMCGPEFYSCAKFINWIFIIGTALIVVWVARFLTISAPMAWLAGGLLLLSPQALRISFFMPDVMFYFMASLAIAIGLMIADGDRSRKVVISFLSILVLATLTKPHGLLLAIGFSIAILVFGHGQVRWRVLLSASSFGLPLFGNLLVPSVLSGFSVSGAFAPYLGVEDPEQTEGIGIADRLVALSQDGGFANALEYGVFAVAAMVAGAVLLIPGFIGAALQTTSSSKESLESNNDVELKTRRSIRFLGTVFASQALLFGAFVFYASLNGESFDNRVVFRYVEFIIPFLLVATFAVYRIKTRTRMGPSAFVGLGISVLVVIWAFYSLGQGITPRFADSAYTLIFSNREVLGAAAFVLLAVMLFQFAGNAAVVRRIFVGGVVVLFPVLGYFSAESLSRTTSSLSVLDAPANALAAAVVESPAEDVVIIAGSRGEAMYLQFASQQYDSEFYVASADGVGPLPQEFSDAWILSVGGHETFESGVFRQTTLQYTLERILNREIHFFGQNMISSPISETSGLVNEHSRFAWVQAESARISLGRGLSTGDTVVVGLVASESGTDESVSIVLGEDIYDLQSPQESGFVQNFEVQALKDGIKEITISVPEGGDSMVGLYSLELIRAP